MNTALWRRAAVAIAAWGLVAGCTARDPETVDAADVGSSERDAASGDADLPGDVEAADEAALSDIRDVDAPDTEVFGDVLVACPEDPVASQGRACLGEFSCSGGTTTCCGAEQEIASCSCEAGVFRCGWWSECSPWDPCLPPTCGATPCQAGWECGGQLKLAGDTLFICVPCGTCEPSCEGLECGDDGCGGTCATCPSYQACVDHECVHIDLPDCTDKECGDDGVGGACGQCPLAWTCDPSGRCEPDAGCESLPAEGVCVNGAVVRCDGGTTAHEPCAFGACVIDGDGIAGCEEAPCIADCFGRRCGDDGCGGTCGTCPDGFDCHAALGVCLPTSGCGAWTDHPFCNGHVLVRCVDGQIQAESCLAQGKVCRSYECAGGAACIDPGIGMPCWWLPAAGHCEGEDHLFTCEDDTLVVKHCKDWWAGSKCARRSFDRYGCDGMFE